MSEKEWATFFELMDKIIHLPNMTANEKQALVNRKAEEHSADLEEFACYCEAPD